MRMSCIDADPGHSAYMRVDRDKTIIDVYLEGVKVNRCLTADEGEGYILAYMKDERGHIVADKDGNSRTVELYGKVEIVLTNI